MTRIVLMKGYFVPPIPYVEPGPKVYPVEINEDQLEDTMTKFMEYCARNEHFMTPMFDVISTKEFYADMRMACAKFKQKVKEAFLVEHPEIVLDETPPPPEEMYV